MNRHTFWCGQSGSGKTYALGVALEQMLLHTRLPIVILDPNSDFVQLGELRRGRAAAEAAELADARHPRAPLDRGPRRAAARAVLSTAAALAGGDPADRSAAATPRTTTRCCASRPTCSALPDHRSGGLHALASPTACAITLAMRLENLGVARLGAVGVGSARASPKIIDDRPDATVVDLGGFATSPSRARPRSPCSIICGSTARSGSAVLIVIDEAHNLCTPDPVTPLERAAHRADRADRGGGSQVRALAAAVDAATVEGAPERAVAVRQPGPHAHELAAGPRRARGGLRVRAGVAAASARRPSARARRCSPAASSISRASCRWARG